MKLITFKMKDSAAGNDNFRVGRLDASGRVLDLTAELFEKQDVAAAEVLRLFDLDSGLLAAAGSSVDAPIVDRELIEYCSPIPRPVKILCIGLNYRDHAEESGMPIPESPIVFSKFQTCIVGSGEAIRIPEGSTQVDYEAELAFVIGRRAKHVPAVDAMEYVFGYTNFNDVSARDFQFADGQWQRGKSCDTFAPVGPFVATRDEVADPHALGIRFRLNGETLQDSNTGQLIFRIPELIEFISRYITLEPGDIVATGTPPGVGFAHKPPIFMKPGDVAEVEIDGLGTLSNPVG